MWAAIASAAQAAWAWATSWRKQKTAQDAAVADQAAAQATAGHQGAAWGPEK